MVELKNFFAEKQREYIVNFIKEYFVNQGGPNTKAVIGISGGKDSTIAAALLCEALGPEKVIGVLMPKGIQNDIKDSIKVCEILGIKYYNINIESAYLALCHSIDEEYDYDHCCSDNSSIATNLPARLRMSTLYSIASLVGGRVCHTGNRSEAFVGYTTKYGDLAGDFSLFKNYTASEVIAIGETFKEIPYELIHKTPGDGMSGKSDEDNLGFTYEELDNYILHSKISNVDTCRKIQERNQMSRHKSIINFPAPMKPKFDENGENEYFRW